MTVEIDFLQKKYIDSNPYDTDKMASEFLQRFYNQAFSINQQVFWGFTGLNIRSTKWLQFFFFFLQK